MIRKKLLGAGIFILALFLSRSVFAEDLVDPQMVQAQNKFALKSFQKLAANNPEGNKIFSALGTGTLLRLFYRDSGGVTREEMAKVLEIEGLEPEVVTNRNGGLWVLSRNTGKPEEVEYWSPMTFLGSDQTEFREDFLRRAGFYKIIPRSYDLKHPFMPVTINEWVKTNTSRRIDNLTLSFDPESPVAVFDAFYFKGKWGVPFNKEEKPAGFFKNGSGNAVSFMAAEGNFDFYRDDTFEGVNLPFSTGRYSLYVLVPSAQTALPDFVASLNASDLENWLRGFLDRPGRVEIPAFRTESDWDVRALLKSLGMERAFSENGDFRQAFANVHNHHFLGSFEQKAVFFVDTESVGAPRTAVPYDIDASPRHERFSLSVNRPFFFILRDNKTGIWLAAGSVSNPD